MTIKDIVNRDIVNLQNCDQEPIHIPGSIQPHGFLMGVNKNTFTILFCSENAEAFCGYSYQQLLGKPISEAFGPSCEEQLKECASMANGLSKTLHVKYGERQLEFITHSNGEYLIIESETYHETVPATNNLYDLSKDFLSYMEDSHTLKQLCALVADGIKKATGYDRVMIYHFDKEYNGEVIAESKRADLESFLGLHYPHTDIPAQARELYIKNLLRIIVDVNYKPVPLYTIDDGTIQTLDLSYSALRSVSPIHVQYLHNMGVGATLTISLIHKKKLWGLVACHHYSPKYLSPDVRLAARLQGHFITSQIDVRQLNEEYEESRKVNEAANALISRKLELNRNSLKEIINDEKLMALCNAAGVSVLIDSDIYAKGLTPKAEDVKTLSAYLSAYTDRKPFHTDHVLKLFPDLKQFAETIPGLNYFPLSTVSDDCIIWYKPESINEVNWAGDPSKAIEKDKNGLSPRKSFALWQETLKHQSKPWLQAELRASANFGMAFQKHFSAVMLTEEEEKQRELAQILQETNAELENINWISTHDLQEPLRKIQMMSSFILTEEEKEIPQEVYEKVARMNKSAERMQALVKDILRYTRLNHTSEAFDSIDLNALLQDVKSEVQDTLDSAGATLQIGQLPAVKGVAFLLKQLFANLIYNSLKFSHANRKPLLSLASVDAKDIPLSMALPKEQFYILRYSDNGIGFEKDYNETVFNIFARLNNTGEYHGSGIGLALCRKIMKAHKGQIKADGKTGEGVDFYISFPKTIHS